MTLSNIKAYYESGKWSLEKLKLLVKNGIISESQFEAVSGEVYSE